jgi:exopolysaccharide production protein ExoQ
VNPNVALFICFLGIAGLFYLDRDKSVRPSRALWIPVLWLGILGSRSVSAWLGIAPPAGVDVQMEGSPVDRFFYQVLLVAGIIVLIRRRSQVSSLLKASGPIIMYFSYCLLSVLWSDFQDVSLKRWIKAVGDLVMVLVIATDAEPVVALKHLFSRLGFVLLPTSIVLIKYFGDLGRGYTPDGLPMNTGVTTNKNALGNIAFVFLLGTLWRVLSLVEDKEDPDRSRHLWAQLTLLAIALWVLVLAQSATSIACALLGATLMLGARVPAIRQRPGGVHALILAIILGGGILFLFNGDAAVTHALGRQENLSGRTDIWAAVLAAGTNPVVGAGFESFWITPRYMAKVEDGLASWWHAGGLNEAHNGYLEVYLELGWVGVSMIAIIFISGYRVSIAAFHRDLQLGSLMLAYVVTEATYSITEAGFRMLSMNWFFLLLAIIVSSRIVAGAEEVLPHDLREPAERMSDLVSSNPYILGCS